MLVKGRKPAAPAPTKMAPNRDDPATREERLAELMEEFRARGSGLQERLTAAALAKNARDLASLARIQGKQALVSPTPGRAFGVRINPSL